MIFLEYKSLYRQLKAARPGRRIRGLPIGEAAVRRPGDDLTIVTYGPTLGFCMEAAETLLARTRPKPR